MHRFIRQLDGFHQLCQLRQLDGFHQLDGRVMVTDGQVMDLDGQVMDLDGGDGEVTDTIGGVEMVGVADEDAIRIFYFGIIDANVILAV
jgi:hypothetical protein